ncbi:MAG TPA: hypothetical protein VKM55_12055 [Candidatus Lokiarchaeia archaeon]|nr:hypothetical protein [Candidatus Lokiarchaeia archaeon]
MAPIIETTLSKQPVASSNSQAMNNDSNIGMKKAYAVPFTLGNDQEVYIKFSDSYANMSVTMKILARAQYNVAYGTNSTPSSQTGKNFIYCTAIYGSSPLSGCTSASSVTIANGGWYSIEFKGGMSGNSLTSIPGDYNVVVYGTNSTTAGNDVVVFSINVQIDGPGRAIGNILSIGGWIAVAIFAVIIAYYAMKKTLNEGRS